MTLEIFTIYDSKVGAYGQPMVFQTKGVALRSFVDIVNDPKSQFFLHPEDFTLFHIASYSQDDGQFKNLAAPVSLGVAKEYHKGYDPKQPEVTR